MFFKEKSSVKMIFALSMFLVTLLFVSTFPLGSSQTSDLLNPLSIPKFTNQLTQAPPIYNPTNVTDNSGALKRQEYTVEVSQFYQQMLPTIASDGSQTGFGQTKVWGYKGVARDSLTGENLGSVGSTPGATFEAIQGVPIQVKWVNNLVDQNGKPLSYMLPVDPTLHWANPANLPMDMTATNAPTYPPGYVEAQTPVPIVTHLHGGEVQSTSDGHPYGWFSATGAHGSAYNTAVSTEPNSAVDFYPNAQQPTTLWYHDHALGLTRLNVLSGLAGFYLIRNVSDPVEKLLPSGEYEMPLAIQDRSFLTDGSLYYPTEGVNPTIHPYWQDTFSGNTIIVNGQVWPNMNVKQGQYRFRILDGSNSRFYQLSFSNNLAFKIIGSEGGFLKAPASVTTKLIAPAERIDILVDFSHFDVGTKIILKNTYGNAEAQTTGQIMQFTVTDQTGFTPNTLPQTLNPTLSSDFPTLPTPVKKRTLTMIDVSNQKGAIQMLLDGQPWTAPVSENPQLGSTEDWKLINPTMNAHPIHLHLVQFQIVSRQNFEPNGYLSEWTRLNGNPPFNHTTVNVSNLDTYLTGNPSGAQSSEQGWKDTVVVNSGEVVTIRIRWAQQNGNPFPFDATSGPGYVWHCHLLEHEDNEMMRPYVVVSSSQNVLGIPLEIIGIVVVVLVVAIVAVVLLLRRSKKNR